MKTRAGSAQRGTVREQALGLLAALAIHAAALVCAPAVLYEPARTGVEPGIHGIEVWLTAPPRERNVSGGPPAADASGPRKIPGQLESPDSDRPSLPATDRTLARGAVMRASPKYKHNPAPSYPAKSRRLKQEGVVILGVDVDRDGSASRVWVERSSGHPLLDRSALQSVQNWNFDPATLGGVPVRSRAQVPVRFRIQEPPETSAGDPF